MLVVFDWEGDLGSNPASAIKHTGTGLSGPNLSHWLL